MRKTEWSIIAAFLLASVSLGSAHADPLDYGQACGVGGCPSGTAATDIATAYQDPTLAPVLDEINSTLAFKTWCQATWDCLFSPTADPHYCGRELSPSQYLAIIKLYVKICGGGPSRPN